MDRKALKEKCLQLGCSELVYQIEIMDALDEGFVSKMAKDVAITNLKRLIKRYEQSHSR